MHEIVKRVLVVDDDQQFARENVPFAFVSPKEPQAFAPFRFDVDVAFDPEGAVDALRAKQYDVAVLDVQLRKVNDGLEILRAITSEYGPSYPVTILFSANMTSIADGVNAMRGGAWDYFVKDSDKYVADRIAKSAVERLRMLDLREVLREKIVRGWLPYNTYQLEQDHAGKLVALWHDPPGVITLPDGTPAAAIDAFELSGKLQGWRDCHRSWEQPYLLSIPPAPTV